MVSSSLVSDCRFRGESRFCASVSSAIEILVALTGLDASQRAFLGESSGVCGELELGSDDAVSPLEPRKEGGCDLDDTRLCGLSSSSFERAISK